MDSVTVLGRCDVGVVVTGFGCEWAWFLTPCCGASAKGGATGVICRACYQPIDPALGDIYDADAYGPLRPLTAEERTVVNAENVIFA